MENISLKNIKLVIWDLDDTFWKGTLSEGGVEEITANTKFVKDLTDRGIVNAICSKNDFSPVIDKLKDFGVNDYFVFNSIDWTPKGERVSRIIKDMGLRPVNVLFIDDNVVNLNEAAFYSKDLMIAEPPVIQDLITQVQTLPVSDKNHTRLKNYRILEEKRDSKATFSDNESFLYSTNTRVEIKKDCFAQLDRIHELILRTNQLNFTKNRMQKEELESLLKEKDVDAGYVHVSDKFGDYGIVGFYAIKNGKCVHFLFSCRTIGQGVEQYVYSILNYPELEIVGKVINDVSRIPAPAWINQDGREQSAIFNNSQKLQNKNESCKNQKIVFKGPCDLMILTSYIKGAGNIIEEFTYQGDKANTIEHHNHSTNILSFHEIDDVNRETLMEECIFNDKQMFTTAIYDKDVALVFLSSLIELNLGVYQRKGSNLRIAFAGYNRPLTDEAYWNHYLSTSQYGNKYTREWLSSFSDKYVFCGRLTPSQILDNYKKILSKLSPNACLCLALGSETPFLNNQSPTFSEREKEHAELNSLLRDWASKEQRVYLLDWNDFIVGQDSFSDNINHFNRNVYYQASIRVKEIIEEITGVHVVSIPRFKRIMINLREKYWKYLNTDSFYYRIMRDMFHKFVTNK